MLTRSKLSSTRTRTTVVGTMILVLLAAAPLAAAMGNENEGILLRSSHAGAGGWSGADAYDPAAGGNPGRYAVAVSELAGRAMTSSLSGDDAYDPAAGGNPVQLIGALAADGSSLVSCGLSADEMAELSGRSILGGFSGDDDYDPAAGGIPDLSHLASVGDLGLLAACVPTGSGN